MKKGIATTLGTLIFVGILFTALIPLQIHMKENKMYIIRSEHEMNIFDSNREAEEIDVIAYPTNLTSNLMFVKVKNKGPVPVVIEKTWINAKPHLIKQGLEPGKEDVFGPFEVILEEDSTYAVKISTQRGRLFSSDTGNLLFISGTWYIASLGISVQIANENGKYYVSVSNSTWSSTYQTQGMDQDDLLVFFDVKTNGNYYVVMRKNSVNGPDLPGSPLIVEVQWPAGPPVVYVYSSGLDM